MTRRVTTTLELSVHVYDWCTGAQLPLVDGSAETYDLTTIVR
jgi:hypothetical protein